MAATLELIDAMLELIDATLELIDAILELIGATLELITLDLAALELAALLDAALGLLELTALLTRLLACAEDNELGAALDGACELASALDTDTLTDDATLDTLAAEREEGALDTTAAERSLLLIPRLALVTALLIRLLATLLAGELKALADDSDTLDATALLTDADGALVPPPPPQALSSAVKSSKPVAFLVGASHANARGLKLARWLV